MSKLVGSLKPKKVKKMSKGRTGFAKEGKFGARKGNKLSVPKATAKVTHSS